MLQKTGPRHAPVLPLAHTHRVRMQNASHTAPIITTAAVYMADKGLAIAAQYNENCNNYNVNTIKIS